MNKPQNGLAVVLCAALGAQWETLHPDIRERFTMAPGDKRQSYTGTMAVVERSFMGWLIARLIAFMHVLPAVRARDVPFAFNLSPAPGAGWIKERLYRFTGGVFEFRSVMRLTRGGELVEQFPWGLGMRIRLGAEGNGGDTLYFRDNGYFLNLGGWRLPLPRWCTVGRFTLAHRNTGHDSFIVEISLDHPLLGRLFYQRGAFANACAARVPDCPDAARTGGRGRVYSPVPACAPAPLPLRLCAPAPRRHPDL